MGAGKFGNEPNARVVASQKTRGIARLAQVLRREKRPPQDDKSKENSECETDRGMKRKKNNSEWIADCKERGEWAELCFMARAKGLGMGVLKPFGESGRYDVAVENGGPIWRVQVKSTIYCRRGNEYSLNVMGPGRKQYKKGTVDFFAVWVIPVGEWYIIPYAAMGKKTTLHFTAGSKRAKWAQYREAWDLLEVIEIQACVDPAYEEDMVDVLE